MGGEVLGSESDGDVLPENFWTHPVSQWILIKPTFTENLTQRTIPRTQFRDCWQKFRSSFRELIVKQNPPLPAEHICLPLYGTSTPNPLPLGFYFPILSNLGSINIVFVPVTEEVCFFSVSFSAKSSHKQKK